MPWFDLPPPVQATLIVGLLLAAALVAGLAGEWLRLPKVTCYLLVGVALGPSLLDAVHHDQIGLIQPLTKLAIALVLFNLGCHFPLPHLRRILGRVLRLSAGELGVTFLLVAAGVFVFSRSWEVALLLGTLALATAPATTILVLKETQSEGPVTEYANALVALNNLVSIVVFELVFLALLFWHGQLRASLPVQLGAFARDLAGSVALGVVAGLVVSYSYPLVAEGRRLVLLVAVITLLLGVCLALDMPYLLAFLAMGLTLANSSYHTSQVLAELDRMTGLLTVVFFVTHGAELRLDQLAAAGAVGIAYLLLRFSGKYLGIWLAARRRQAEPAVRDWLGVTLVAQAGAAIALSSMAAERAAGTGLEAVTGQVQTIILGTVVVFEIAGPLLIRHAVIKAGEVPLAHALHRAVASPVDHLRTVGNRLLIAVGRDPWANRQPEDMSVNEIMRRNVKAIPRRATFDEVVASIEQSRDNTFPVVDEAGGLVGVIRYRELSHALFDRGLGTLVRAEDVTTPAGRVLYPDEPLSRASAIFAASKDDCIPVVGNDPPRPLLGVVRRRDVLRLLIRDRKERAP